MQGESVGRADSSAKPAGLRERWRARRAVPRTVEVAPPSRADEAGWVLLAAGAVLLGVIYVYGFERFGSGGGEAATAAGSGLLPYQVLFRDLPSAEQRTFRALQEGAGEAVRRRGADGKWPSVEALADAAIPPFAPDPLDKAKLQWSAGSEGLLANYLGVPAVSGAPAFLIFVQEPDPVSGEKPSSTVVDEEHQLLPDGALLHVTFWKRTSGGPPSGLIADPALAGWQQIRVKTPLDELEAMEQR